jgi:LPXTG-motif cell wall-anchored protein
VVAPTLFYLRAKFTATLKLSQLLTEINQETENFGEKMKMLSIKRGKGLNSISALLLVGVLSISQSGQFMAAADEITEATTIATVDCSATSEYLLKISGNFPTQLNNVAIDYVNIAPSMWTQSASEILVRVPGTNPKPGNLILFYGTLQHEMVNVNCAQFATVSDETTEDGGLLPDTATNNYNYLAAGLVLALVGAVGLLRRKAVKA